MAIKIIELHSVAPSHGGAAATAAEKSLPLLYFDMIWLQSGPIVNLYFYHLKCSESCFLDTIVGKLKHSLSTALHHFLPLAGKIIFPLNSSAMPVSRYVAGNSVSLTIAVSDADFAHLTGNHSRAADEFHQFVPQMLPAVYSDSDDHDGDEIKLSVLAIQVTLFPNQGICIGFSKHHSICDLTSLFAFVNAWAAIYRQNGDGDFIGKFLPSYDRSRTQDADKLTKILWNQMGRTRPMVLLNPKIPSSKVRAPFILTKPEIEKLKSFSRTASASTFVVVSAYVWSCLAKSTAVDEVADNEPEYLTSPVDCRSRLDPPLPETYFGNCLLFLRATSTHGRLKGKEGFLAGVEAIAAAVWEATVGKGGGILGDVENLLERESEMIGKRRVRIAGSSRFNPYGVDYGWGRAIKYEIIDTDFDGAISLCEARDGGVEIGMLMTKAKLGAFANIFKKELYINGKL